MKKNGFTLTEVLIALAIIGVVTALTIPTLNNNINSQKIGPSLAHFVGEFENAMGMYILDHNSQPINGTTAEFIDLENYLKLSPQNATNGTTNADNRTWFLKGGGSLTIEDEDGVDKIDPAGNRNNAGAICNVLMYDINGDANPNETGQDRFYFYLADNGTLYPMGGANIPVIYNGGTAPACTNLGITCSLNAFDESTQDSTAPEITGAIADNNWTTRGLTAYEED